MISQGDEDQTLMIKLNAQGLFQSESHSYVEQQYQMTKKIPRQIDPGLKSDLEQFGDTVEAATTTAFFGNVMINTIFQGSMNQLLSAVSTLQVITHNMLINVKTPPNTQIFYSYLLGIASFDIFETEDMIT